MAELFQTSISNFNMYLKNIFEQGELDENRTIKEFLIVQQKGNRGVKPKLIAKSIFQANMIEMEKGELRIFLILVPHTRQLLPG